MPVVDMLFCVAMVEAFGAAPGQPASAPAWTGPSASQEVRLLGDRAVSDPLFCLRASKARADTATRIRTWSRFPASAIAMRRSAR